MNQPKLYTGTSPLAVELDTVFHVVKIISSAGKETEFLDLCRKSNFTMSAGADLVNLAKTYLFSQNLHATSPFAAAVVQSDPSVVRCFPPTQQ